MKEPFTTEICKAIAKDATRKGFLGDICLAATCLLAFAGFLRHDELSNIQPCDIKFDVNHITIAIPTIDQGNEVVIARTNATTFPGALHEQRLLEETVVSI